MKILLAAIHTHRSPQAVPLANASLKAYLATDEELAEQSFVILRDFFLQQTAQECVDTILAENPDVVGFSTYLWNRERCREMAALLRDRKPDIILVAGGPEPTADPEGVLRQGGYDYLIIGEGELPFRELISCLVSGNRPPEIPGIAFLRDGEVVKSPGAALRRLDDIPSPCLEHALDLGQYQGALWELSRGCDFSCDYCFDGKGGDGVRRFSLERIEEELTFFARRRVTQIFVLDSTFNTDMARAKKILRMIRKRAPHIHFHFEVRSEFLDREMARLFAEITCSLQIGLQSADPAVLKGLRRFLNRSDFTNRIALLNESGAVFGFDLIYGLPGDTLAGFAESMDFALGLYPNHLDIFPLAILPGTSLAERAAGMGIIYERTAPYLVTGTPAFPAEAMEKARGLAVACDIFYSRGKAVAWFNSVLAALGMKPSAFLGEFWNWLKDRSGEAVTAENFTGSEIWQLQREFLSRIFGKRKKQRLLPLALDLVDYHYHYAQALMTPPPELPTDRDLASRDLINSRFTIPGSTQLATFNHEIYDILESGEIDLADFVSCFSPVRSFAAIYPRAGEVFTESLHESFHSLLQSLTDNPCPAATIQRLGIPAPEAASFLEFAAAEGIISIE